MMVARLRPQASNPQGGRTKLGRKPLLSLPHLTSRNRSTGNHTRVSPSRGDSRGGGGRLAGDSTSRPQGASFAQHPELDRPEIDRLRSICAQLCHHILFLHKRLVHTQELLQAAGLPLDGDLALTGDDDDGLTIIMATPLLNQFFESIAELVSSRNGAQLQDYLQLEPPLSDTYRQMIIDLRTVFPSGSPGDANLTKWCEDLAQKARGSPWPAFAMFMRQYFCFLRDVNTDHPLETYNALKALLNQCISALGDSKSGVVMLPTALYLSKILAKLAIGLDRRPELVSQLLQQEGRSTRDEAVEKVTLVEQSANVVREAFIKCLTDRSGAPEASDKPEGKRVGIYLMANLCLKLLFRCGKLRNAEQMFASINAHSPPLDAFPASQRVTYLYYLGRYLFSNNLFYPAQKALQAAYDQCHRQALQQKHLILVYLITCNMIMGRFPSAELLKKPEAQGLAEHFVPLCRIIAQGDYLAFRRHLAVDAPTAQWFGRKGILFQLRNRCEILVWRSLTRKVFIYGGFQGETNPAQRGPPPVLYLSKLVTAVNFIQRRHSQPSFSSNVESKQESITIPFPPDSDFEGLDGFTPRSTARPAIDDYLSPDGFFDETGTWQENPSLAPVDGEPNREYVDRLEELNPYGSGYGDPESNSALLLREVESILASLLTQGLMRGYLTHANPRYAIPGARARGALPTGFPNVWQTISARERQEGDNVPGWVRALPGSSGSERRAENGPVPAIGGGRVINLKGARPVGAQ